MEKVIFLRNIVLLINLLRRSILKGLAINKDKTGRSNIYG
jgi:hypothetical protein